MTESIYTIVGAGAIGGTLAMHMHAAGVPVQLVDADPAHVAAIRESGLTLLSPAGSATVRLPVFGLSDAPARLDRVLLAVKAQVTDAASAWIAPRLAADGYIASLQNGLNEGTIASHVGADRTVVAFVDLFADVMKPGTVKDGGHGAMALGEYSGGVSERVFQLAADLSHWGSAVVTDNVEGFLWSKLGFGAMLTATALVDDDMSALVDRHRPAMIALAREIFDVSNSLGIRLEAFDAFDPEPYRRGADPMATDAALTKLSSWLGTQTKTRSGIWRDIVVRQRPTEVPSQYMPVLAIGAEHGIELPLVRALVTAIARLESGKEQMSEDSLDELDYQAAAVL